MDQHFRWDSKHKKKIKILKYIVLVLAKLKKILSPTNLLTILYGIYYSIATYGMLAWGSALKNAYSKIFESTQKNH